LHQLEGADVRVGHIQDFFGRTGLDELVHHLAAQVARVFDLAVELAVAEGASAAFTKLHILLYTILLVLISVMPFLIFMSGMLYLVGAMGLGAGFIYYAWKLYQAEGDGYAMQTFGYSIFYLTALFAFLLADHYLRLLSHHLLLN
ncbi:MAG TPA: hypothetical protein PLN94_19310, partial [Thiolinea sp.]|nr:hypothetical protein [Thiolinea sp.]